MVATSTSSVLVRSSATELKALTDAKNDRPVAQGPCASTPVDREYRAGQRMGLEGTPMILTDDGRLLGGYLPPDALLQRLDALDKNPDAS